MSFRDFTFPQVVEQLGLSVNSEPMFADVRPVEITANLREQLAEGLILANGSDNETARARFAVAPVLVEFWRRCERRHGVFSGPQFDVDPSSGLCGPCGFLVTRGPEVMILTAPVALAIEVENGTANFRLGPCIAGMRAAWLFNQAKGTTAEQIYGAATTGTVWKFLRLRDTEPTVDRGECYVRDVGTILGILLHLAATA